jgi:hypothetical protein
MFSKKQMGVVDWWVFWLLMAIPVVNIVMFFILLLSGNTNPSLKNYLLALILPVIIGIVLLASGALTLGFLNR